MHHFSHRLSFVIILVLLTVAAHAQNDMEYGYRPKMLVYENLKNDSVLRDFRRRFHLMERVVFETPFETGKIRLRHGSRPLLDRTDAPGRL